MKRKPSQLWFSVGSLVMLTLILATLYIHWSAISYQLLRWQLQFHRELGVLLRAAVTQDPLLITSLLASSFAYGVFHAAGPGHGKLVLTTYLSTQPSRLRQALELSVGAALLQAIVAISLIAFTSWLLGMTARQAQSLGIWFERGSFLLVALMGAYLAQKAVRRSWQLYRQGQKPRTPIRRILAPLAPRAEACGAHPTPGLATFSRPSTAPACGCGHVHAPTPQALAQANDWRSQLGILLSMGMRPCGGALLILILAKVMNHFWLGVLATLAMAAGTALTVASLALISQRARHLAQRLLQGSASGHYRWALMGQGVALCGGLILMGIGISLMSTPGSLLLPR